MNRIALITAATAAAALLAACSDGNADADGDGTVSMKEAADQAEAEAVKPQPGLYRLTATMTEVSFPGMPEELKGHGGGMTNTSESCLTEADVNKGYEELLKQGQDGECSFEKFNLKGGALDAVMVCKTPQGESRMAMTGTTTPTSSEFTATTKVNLEGLGEGTMKFTAKNERIGDCPAKK
jgi:hypothetical protein